MDYSPSGFSVHGILQADTGVGCHAPLQGIFPDPRIKPVSLSLLHWQVGSLSLAPHGKPPRASIIQDKSFHPAPSNFKKYNAW